MKIDYRLVTPPKFLDDFVESFWMLSNLSDEKQDIIVLPDGRVDLFLTVADHEPFRIVLLGLDTKPFARVILPGKIIYAISFKPIAISYLFKKKIASIKNTALVLPNDFWGFQEADLNDFDQFCVKAIDMLDHLMPKIYDDERIKLFNLIYEQRGEIKVKEVARTLQWNERSMNRFFNKNYGISLKQYATIIRFKSAFKQLKEGFLYPKGDFTDQSHFIKEIKKNAGVTPKELYVNEGDKFIQITIENFEAAKTL